MICKCSSTEFVGNSHCPTCCVSFAGDGYFDKHLIKHKGKVVAHLSPEEMGLTWNPKRGWGPPPGIGLDSEAHRTLSKSITKARKSALITPQVARGDVPEEGRV